MDRMLAEGILRQAREQLVEHLLAELPRAAWRQLQTIPLPGDIARLLEASGHPPQRREVVGGLGPQQLPHLLVRDVIEARGRGQVR